MSDLNAQSMLRELVSTNTNAQAETKEIYRIGDLAREFDVSLRTLRFYEDRGLISPQRSRSTRLYTNEDRYRLKVILLAKNVGFSLDDIQDILKVYDDEGEDNSEHITFLSAKFQEQYDRLKAQRAELDESIDALAKAIDSLKIDD